MEHCILQTDMNFDVQIASDVRVFSRLKSAKKYNIKRP
jgi:hypothetical protein